MEENYKSGKKKNVILLVIDSLSADEIFSEHGYAAMPFFHELVKKSIYLDKFYSSGPHSEAGLKALLCGIDTLDNNGYMLHFSDTDKMIMDYFRDNGYDVYNFCDMLTSLPKRIDDTCKRYYTTFQGFSSAIAFYRIPFFAQLFKNNMLDAIDILDLTRLYEELFRVNIDFYSGDKNDTKYSFLRNRMRDVSFEYLLNLHLKEYNKFNQNKIDYLMRDIKNGRCNDNLTVDLQNSRNGASYDKLHRINAEERWFLHYMQLKDVVGNIFDYRNFNSIDSIKNLFDIHLNNGILPFQLRNIGSRLLSIKYYYKLQVDRRMSAQEKSFRGMLEYLRNFVNEISGDPFFIYLHTNNLHNLPIEFFTHDGDEDLIRRELADAKEMLSRVKKYHGHIGYLLGMKYTDICLKDFLKEFDENDLFKNTLLVITSDHGSPNGSRPIRNKERQNNCHSELYHVPLLFYETGVRPRLIQEFYGGKDFLPSLLDYCGIEKDSYLTGQSIFDDSARNNITHSERIGSGCPCMNHRKVIYTARNNQWLIEYQVGVYDDFSQGELTDAYNIAEDPDEMHNVTSIIKKDHCKCIANILDYLENRHINLQKNYHDWKQRHGYPI